MAAVGDPQLKGADCDGPPTGRPSSPPPLSRTHYSRTRVDVSRSRDTQVDATNRERRPSPKLNRAR